MIVGIRFRPHGQLYYFSASMDVAVGNHVIVETEQGKGIGCVYFMYETLPDSSIDTPLTPILRVASEEDCRIGEENAAMARDAFAFCKTCIKERNLDMKLVDVEVFFDKSKIIFFFTAPARIDFRELVKDLVREYRSRIELRQIGVRHETQMVGAVGNCGMVCCCKRYLRKFSPVTIRMAKEQNLFLNPTKISGICSRLLCCLSYEQENYDNFHNQCPKLGKRYQTSKGAFKVLRANMFRNSVTVLTEQNEEQEFTLEEWKELEPNRPEQQASTKIIAKTEKPSYEDGLMVVSMTPHDVEHMDEMDESDTLDMQDDSHALEQFQDPNDAQNTLMDAIVKEDVADHIPTSKPGKAATSGGGIFGLSPQGSAPRHEQINTEGTQDKNKRKRRRPRNDS